MSVTEVCARWWEGRRWQKLVCLLSRTESWIGLKQQCLSLIKPNSVESQWNEWMPAVRRNQINILLTARCSFLAAGLYFVEFACRISTGQVYAWFETQSDFSSAWGTLHNQIFNQRWWNDSRAHTVLYAKVFIPVFFLEVLLGRRVLLHLPSMQEADRCYLELSVWHEV